MYIASAESHRQISDAIVLFRVASRENSFLRFSEGQIVQRRLKSTNGSDATKTSDARLLRYIQSFPSVKSSNVPSSLDTSQLAFCFFKFKSRNYPVC